MTRRPASITLCIVGLLLLWTTSVSAHGGGALQINNAPVGDCLTSVWVAPATPRANAPLHVTIGMAEGGEGIPVLTGTANVILRESESGAELSRTAATTRQSVNRLFYEADLAEVGVGTYRVDVDVSCLGSREILTFDLEVSPATNPLFIAMPLVAAVMIFGTLIYLSWQRRGQGAQPVQRR